MATELAKAYVQIIPSAEGIQGSITNVLSGEAASAGKKSGGLFSSGLGASIKKAVVGLGIGKVLSDAISGASEFETAMAKASTLFTGSADEFDALKGKVLELSGAYGMSATTLAEAAYSAESASVPMENLGAMLESSARLAQAGFTDVDTALSATAKTMNAYGSDAKMLSGELMDMDAVQKVLIQTQNLGITTVGELGASLANVTPTAAAMGVTFDQVGAALAQMTASGVPTAQATTQLRSAMTELGKSGTKADKAFRAAAKGTKYAGMGFKEAQAAGATLGDVFGLMQTYADQTGVSMVDLWGSVEAGNAAMLIAGDVDTFNRNLEAMGTEADVVGEAYGKMADTFGNSMNRLKESAKNFMTTLFQGGDISASFDQMLSSAGDIGQKLLGWIENAIRGIATNLPQMMGSLIDFGAGLIESLANVDWIGLGASILNGIIGALGTLGTRLIELVSSAITGITSGSIDFGSIGEAIWNGVTSVITTAGDWLKTLFETAKNAICGDGGIDFSGIGNKILDGVKTILDEGGKFLANLFGFGRDAASDDGMGYDGIGTKILDGVKSVLDSAGKFLGDLFQTGLEAAEERPWPTVGEAIKTGVNLALNGGKFLSEIFSAGAELIKGINWTNVGQHVEGLIVAGLDGATTLVNTFVDASTRLITSIGWESIGQSITTLINAGLNGAAQIVETVSSAASRLLTSIGWESIGGSITNLLNAGLNGAEQLVTTVSNAAGRLITSIGWESIGGSITGLLNSGLDGAEKIVSTVSSAASRLLTSIKWESIGSSASDMLSKGLSGAASMLESGFRGAVDFLNGVNWGELGGKISNGLGDVWGGITGFLGGALTGAGDMLSGAGTGIGDVFKAGGQALAKLITGDDFKRAAEDAKQAMSALQKAIEDGKTNVEAAAKNAGKAVVEGLRSGLEDGSLTQLGYTSGTSLVEEINNGIDARQSTLINAMSSLCTSASDSFKTESTWTGAGSSAMDSLSGGIEKSTSKVKTKLTTLATDIINAFKQKDWTSAGNSAMDTLAGGITRNSAISIAVNAKAATALGLFKLTNWSSAGSALSEGIANGISSSSYLIYAQIRAIASATMNLIKNLFGIHSPSAVMRDQVGRWIPAGIAEGIEMYTGLVDDAIDNMAGGMTSNLQSALATQASGFAGAAAGMAADEDALADSVAQGVSAANTEQTALLREQNGLLRRLLESGMNVRLGASATLGRTVRQSMEMYSAVGG